MLLRRTRAFLIAGVIACGGAPVDGRAPGEPVPSAEAVVSGETDPLAAEPWGPGVLNQRCVALEPVVSSVGALADSAAIARAVADAAVGAGHVLWTIAFDGNGRLADLRVLETTLAHTSVHVLGSAVRAALLPQQEERYVRLRVDADGAGQARVRVGGAQYCQAALINVDAVRLAMAAVDRSGSLEVRLYIDQEGHVQDSTIVRSSGDETTDRMVLGLVAGMRYSPARLERRTVPSRLTFQVNLD